MGLIEHIHPDILRRLLKSGERHHAIVRQDRRVDPKDVRQLGMVENNILGCVTT